MMMSHSTFKLASELTFDTVVANRKSLFHYILSQQTNPICLDLSEVKQCDSAGLALLIDSKKLCQKQGKQFRLTGVPKETQSLAEFCGVQDVLI